MNLENIMLSESSKIPKTAVAVRVLQKNRTSRICLRELAHAVVGAASLECVGQAGAQAGVNAVGSGVLRCHL